MMILGLFNTIVPAGAAALLFSNPVTLVLTAAFIGKSAKDQRKRLVAERRQKARTATRQHLDNVQFAVTAGLTDSLRQRQRELRDAMLERVTEAIRTTTEQIDRTRTALTGDAAERSARRAVVVEQLAGLDVAAAALSSEAVPA
jgi:predicted transcriptional regulator